MIQILNYRDSEMPLEELYNEDACQILLKVICEDVKSEKEIHKTFDDLDEALSIILEKSKDDDIYFFSFLIEGEGASLQPEDIDSSEQHGFYGGDDVPWVTFCPEFWDSACSFPKTHERVKAWVKRLESVLKRSEAYGRSTESLWEHDETQFGEPIITHLASTHLEFVPNYTNMLRLWDLGHEVSQNWGIARIIGAHGFAPEVEALLYVRVAINPGQHGPDLIEEIFPVLEKAYGSFVDTDLFKRIVFHQYAQSFLSSDTGNVSRDYMIFNYSDHVALKAGMERIYSMLDSISGAGTRA